MKDFIKVGLDFVRGHPDADQLQLNIRAEKMDGAGVSVL